MYTIKNIGIIVTYLLLLIKSYNLEKYNNFDRYYNL